MCIVYIGVNVQRIIVGAELLALEFRLNQHV